MRFQSNGTSSIGICVVTPSGFHKMSDFDVLAVKVLASFLGRVRLLRGNNIQSSGGSSEQPLDVQHIR